MTPKVVFLPVLEWALIQVLSLQFCVAKSKSPVSCTHTAFLVSFLNVSSSSCFAEESRALTWAGRRRRPLRDLPWLPLLFKYSPPSDQISSTSHSALAQTSPWSHPLFPQLSLNILTLQLCSQHPPSWFFPPSSSLSIQVSLTFQRLPHFPSSPQDWPRGSTMLSSLLSSHATYSLCCVLEDCLILPCFLSWGRKHDFRNPPVFHSPCSMLWTECLLCKCLLIDFIVGAQ